MAASTKNRSRNLQLDFMRGIAILLVIGHHWVMPWQKVGHLKPIAKAWFVMGWSGVDLFFVLSGFLIGGLLMEEIKTRHSLDVKRFIIRRGFKIWPLYFLAVLAYTAYYTIKDHSLTKAILGSHKHVGLWTNYLHVQNYFGTPMLVTWSLAVEEHFYLILPFVLMFLAARTKDRGGIGKSIAIPVIAVSLMVICTALRFMHIHDQPVAKVEMWPTHLRIDGLFLGVLLAYLYHFKTHTFAAIGRYKPALIVCGLALVMPMAFIDEYNPFTWTIGYTMLYWGYAMLLMAAFTASTTEGVGAKFFNNPVSKSIAFIGFSSYPIYLFHSNIGQVPATWVLHHHLVGKHGDITWLAIMAIYIGTSTVIGAVLGKLIEIPTLALRDRLFPGKAGALQVTPATGPPEAAPMPPILAEAEREEEAEHMAIGAGKSSTSMISGEIAEVDG